MPSRAVIATTVLVMTPVLALGGCRVDPEMSFAVEAVSSDPSILEVSAFGAENASLAHPIGITLVATAPSPLTLETDDWVLHGDIGGEPTIMTPLDCDPEHEDQPFDSIECPASTQPKLFDVEPGQLREIHLAIQSKFWEEVPEGRGVFSQRIRWVSKSSNGSGRDQSGEVTVRISAIIRAVDTVYQE